jgi:hypothetical protein
MSPKNTATSTPPERTLSRIETIAQLARRRAIRMAQATHRRTRDAGSDIILAGQTGVTAAGHKYRMGQIVTLVPKRYGANRLCHFNVAGLLPQEHGINHYRLKSVVDGHERIATEDELI